jgi:hypothetical protein
LYSHDNRNTRKLRIEKPCNALFSANIETLFNKVSATDVVLKKVDNNYKITSSTKLSHGFFLQSMTAWILQKSKKYRAES